MRKLLIATTLLTLTAFPSFAEDTKTTAPAKPGHEEFMPQDQWDKLSKEERRKIMDERRTARRAEREEWKKKFEAATPEEKEKMKAEMEAKKAARKAEWDKRYETATPEEKARMDKRREHFEERKEKREERKEERKEKLKERSDDAKPEKKEAPAKTTPAAQ